MCTGGVLPTCAPTEGPPTLSPTVSPTVAPTVRPTIAPTVQPTVGPTITPTGSPTEEPTIAPTVQPTIGPTLEPTLIPTMEVTTEPPIVVTILPTEQPTSEPTITPTAQPTVAPTQQPTLEVTSSPTSVATQQPTVAPTAAPTNQPTVAPTNLPPTAFPTVGPTEMATNAPTSAPTQAPTVAPTIAPTVVPTNLPTAFPTVAPTEMATNAPTSAPTQAPTVAPTIAPTVMPTNLPTLAPTQMPTNTPTGAPTAVSCQYCTFNQSEYAKTCYEQFSNQPFEDALSNVTCASLALRWTMIPAACLVTHCYCKRIFVLGNATNGGFTVNFTSAVAVDRFLPENLPPGIFDTNLTDPLSTSAGSFAGELLTAELNIAFSSFLPYNLSLLAFSDECEQAHPLIRGRTVLEVIFISHQVIGGDPFNLYPSYTPTILTQALALYNNNFNNCSNVNPLCITCSGATLSSTVSSLDLLDAQLGTVVDTILPTDASSRRVRPSRLPSRFLSRNKATTQPPEEEEEDHIFQETRPVSEGFDEASYVFVFIGLVVVAMLLLVLVNKYRRGKRFNTSPAYSSV